MDGWCFTMKWTERFWIFMRLAGRRRVTVSRMVSLLIQRNDTLHAILLIPV